MESNAFGSAHIPSQALVVLSEAASGLHEALRGQRPFPSRLPDAKDLHNMSLVGSYGTHLLHSFHPHLLQTLNHHGILAANGSTAAAASYFANDRTGLTKPLTNFQLPSAFSPPKYIGISLDQNLFNGSDSFRTDSASPTCTSHESLEGSNDYDGEKGESPRSNASDPRDLRHVHSKASSTCASSMTVSAAAAAAAVASIASSSAVVAATTATVAAASHLAQQSHAHHHPPHHHHHHHPAHHLAAINNHHHAHHTNGSLLAAASMTHTLNLAASHACGGLRPLPGHVPDVCPICGLKLTNDEWNSHFLTELDRLYKLSSGMERASLQATYMFAPPCPVQENAIRTSHSRWETFQRIRNNRQNRLRLKVRKRKYGDMFLMENMLCSSCPICKRKYGVDNLSGNRPGDEDRDHKMQDDIETVDVESCNDEMPDSGMELQHHQQHLSVTTGHAHMSTLSGSSSNHSHTNLNGANLHNSNSQPGKLDGILYRTTSLAISKDHNNTSGGGGGGGGEEDDNTNIATATTTTSSTVSNGSSGSNSGQGDVNNWPELTHGNGNNNNQAHISVKNVNELSSTTHTVPSSSHHYYHNADSCHEEHQQHQHHQQQHGKEAIGIDMCNNDSDEDVIVDDEESFKISSFNSQHSHQHNRKRKYEDAVVGSSSRIIANQHSPLEERPRSEPQVTSTECNLEMHHNNNNNNNNSNSNNNNNTKYLAFEDLRMKSSPDSESLAGSQQQQHQQTHALMAANLTHLDSSTTAKVGISSDLKSDIEENKCFICKTGIKDLTVTDNFLRGRNFYFHQSCANVMSSYRFNKDLPAAATTTTAASVNPLLLAAHSQKSSHLSQAAIVSTSPKDKINQQQKQLQQHIILEATNENQN